QKIISAVWRVGGRFGANHVGHVLLGRNTEAIRRHSHEQLSVYGLLSADGELAVRSWIDQLVVQGYLDLLEKDQFTLLTMTAAGRELCGLKSNPSDGVRLGRYARRRGLFGRDREALPARGSELFERLRALRRVIADRQAVPPYVVFSDATLSEMATIQPSSTAEMRLVKGVGDTKLERYGDAFLAALRGDEIESAASRAGD
ncbi:MAG TPA: HRDC domain-containing protein, partial [Chloroflexota bacterium]|nr:HRDC domain-containing protein [Chloroflexota bacterium]